MKKKKNITLDTIIIRNKDIDSTDIDGDKVMMNLELGQYFALNDIASNIWNKIENPIKVGTLVERLIGEYDITYEECKESILKFLNVISKVDLIQEIR
ncbi:MAG: PqqD family peptide modification chaperone [Peptostreptococcaceae bacterium]